MTVSINIPEKLYQQARDIAESQHLSVDEVISSAFAEHLVAWEKVKERAARGSRGRASEFSIRCPTSIRKITIDSNRFAVRQQLTVENASFSASSGVCKTNVCKTVSAKPFKMPVCGFYWNLVRPERLELPTCWFEARRSIQLSYGRTCHRVYHRRRHPLFCCRGEKMEPDGNRDQAVSRKRSEGPRPAPAARFFNLKNRVLSNKISYSTTKTIHSMTVGFCCVYGAWERRSPAPRKGPRFRAGTRSGRSMNSRPLGSKTVSLSSLRSVTKSRSLTRNTARNSR